MTLDEDLKKCHDVIAKLRHQLHLHLRYRYGQRAEKLDPNQLLLFDEEEVPEGKEDGDLDKDKDKGDEEDPVAPQSKPKKKRSGRQRLPADLPRQEIVEDVPEEEKICSCCGLPMDKIGEDVSEQAEFKPAEIFVVRKVRPKYGCGRCKEEIVQRSPEPQIIDRCLAGPGLLAQVVVAKYADHLPLYRQERIFARSGLELSRKTMCGWIAQLCGMLPVLLVAMREEILKGPVINTDDTPVSVFDPKLEKTRKGYFWVYLGGLEEKYCFFEYTPTRSGAWAAALLEGFEGYLQADAFPGYNGLYKDGRIFEVACWAHVRRKFYEARSVDPARANVILLAIRELYEVERTARKQKLLPEARMALRQERAAPVLDKIETWLKEEEQKVLPKSPLGEAIGYAKSNWTALKRYLEDGQLEIDNLRAERAIRGLAIGRKNWLFVGSDEGGRRAAGIYSLVETCKLNGVEPFEYFRDLFTRLPSHPRNRILELAPPQWKRARDALAEEPDTS